MIVPLAFVFALASVVASAPTIDVPPPAESPATRRLIVNCSATEFESLRAELMTRWPGADVLPYGTAAFEQTAGLPFAYLEVQGERFGDAPVAITLVLSDGRAYLRRVVPSDAARARVLAVAIANLLGAVADEDVPPDRVNVAVPTPVDEPAPIVEPKPTPAEPVAPAPVIDVADDPVVRPPARPEPLPRRWNGWRLGPRASLGLLLGLAPASGRGRPAFAGVLGLDARAPRGLAFGLGVRIAGDAAQGFRLVRTRLAPWLGYVARVRALEIVVGAGPTLEPWRLSRGGDGITLASRDGTGWTILYGAAARAGLGWWTPLRTRAPSSLRLGLDVELAASAQSSGKSARIRVTPRGPELFALGGLELALAAEAVWWFDLRPRGGGRRRPGSAAQ